MKLNHYLAISSTFVFIPSSLCWQYFVPLTDLVMVNSIPDTLHSHSQYMYGDCKVKRNRKVYGHAHVGHLDVLGKLIVRGWVDIPRIPTCIILRAMAYRNELFRSTAYAFQMCVPRITYCHERKRFKYFYYEWYLPYDFMGGMDWDIYFSGPSDMFWGQ